MAFAADEKPLLKTQAQFKLFTLIDMLQKLKLGGASHELLEVLEDALQEGGLLREVLVLGVGRELGGVGEDLLDQLLLLL